MTRRQLPAFANEEEEANWWFDNREELENEFCQAFAEGRVKRGGAVRRMKEAQALPPIKLSMEDGVRAIRIAEAKGVEVESLMATLIHEVLQQEARKLQAEYAEIVLDTAAAR